MLTSPRAFPQDVRRFIYHLNRIEYLELIEASQVHPAYSPPHVSLYSACIAPV